MCHAQPIAPEQPRPPPYPASRGGPCTAVCHSPPRPDIASPPHYLALLAPTLPRLTPPTHWATPGPAPTMVPPPANAPHRLALPHIHLAVCRATGRPNAPTLRHARFDAPPNAQAPPTVAAPTVAAQTHCCANHCYTIHHTAHHTNHCCTNTVPNTTEPTAPTLAIVAPATATLAMLHHTLCAVPSRHTRLLARPLK